MAIGESFVDMTETVNGSNAGDRPINFSDARGSSPLFRALELVLNGGILYFPTGVYLLPPNTGYSIDNPEEIRIPDNVLMLFAPSARLLLRPGVGYASA